MFGKWLKIRVSSNSVPNKIWLKHDFGKNFLSPRSSGTDRGYPIHTDPIGNVNHPPVA